MPGPGTSPWGRNRPPVADHSNLPASAPRLITLVDGLTRKKQPRNSAGPLKVPSDMDCISDRRVALH